MSLRDRLLDKGSYSPLGEGFNDGDTVLTLPYNVSNHSRQHSGATNHL